MGIKQSSTAGALPSELLTVPETAVLLRVSVLARGANGSPQNRLVQRKRHRVTDGEVARPRPSRKRARSLGALSDVSTRDSINVNDNL
jgi:hypothetical protein